MAEPVATLRFKAIGDAVSSIEFVNVGSKIAPHKHDDAQLMLVTRGLVSCEVAKGLWLVPPQRAMWIPAGMEHRQRGVGKLQVYCVYIQPALVDRLPQECCTLTVSPLLRELVIETSRLPSHYEADGPDGRMIGTMLDRLALAQVEQLHLPMPADPRLRKVAECLIADPSDRTRLPQLARKVGMSQRSLGRRLSQETGMSFSRWRQQSLIVLALKRLSQGDSVQAIALDLGYKSASAFVTMFRKTLGKPPLKFLADRSPDAGAVCSSKRRS